MLRDLCNDGPKLTSLAADVVVIGAGLAGLVLAAHLGRTGARVVVLESGARYQASDIHPLNEVVHSGQVYSGAESGRFRCLGGTSTRWGGAMLPFLPCDMGRHTAGWDVDWPVAYQDLEGEFAELERAFDLPEGSFEPQEGPGIRGDVPGFTMRSAKWPAFKLRNAAYTFRHEIAEENLEVWLNAHVTRLQCDEAGRLAKVIAVSPSGKQLDVTAPIFVIAAGAIESTRLLLLLDAQHSNRIFAPDGVLGHYFYDHLSAPVGSVEPVNRDALNEAFGMRFDGTGMRDRRLEPTPALRAELRLPGAFAHVVPISDGNDGFAALRSIYRDIQRRVPARVHDVGAVLRDLGWFSRAVWWRYGKQRLLAPNGARFEIYLNIEQKPDVDNRITLADGATDVFGNPLASIDWSVRSADVETFRRIQTELVSFWRNGPYASLGALQAAGEETWKSKLYEAADIYHPGGSTRLGSSRSSGVLDSDLKTYQVNNLYVVSTSAFPSGGTSNPSFMLMAFALRAARQIAQRGRWGSRASAASRSRVQAM